MKSIKFLRIQSHTPLILGIFLILVCLLSVLYLLGLWNSTNLTPNTFSGFDIYTDCADNLTADLSFNLSLNTVRVNVRINDWDKHKDNCNSITIFFPGMTSEHQYYKTKVYSENSTINSKEVMRHVYMTLCPLNEGVEYYWSPSEEKHTILLKTKEIEGFPGEIQFDWQDGLKQLNFSDRSICLPFMASISRSYWDLYPIQHYQISVLSPSKYELISSVPPVLNYKIIGSANSYLFEIERNKSDFILRLVNPTLKNIKDYFLIIASALFGVGFTVIINNILGHYHKRLWAPTSKRVLKQIKNEATAALSVLNSFYTNSSVFMLPLEIQTSLNLLFIEKVSDGSTTLNYSWSQSILTSENFFNSLSSIIENIYLYQRDFPYIFNQYHTLNESILDIREHLNHAEAEFNLRVLDRTTNKYVLSPSQDPKINEAIKQLIFSLNPLLNLDVSNAN